MSENYFIVVLASLGLFQGVFLSLYLITLKTGNRKLNIYLSLILLGLSIRIGKSILGFYFPLEAWQKNIGISGSLIVGPFLWFYGMALFDRMKNFSKIYYLHLLPFALYTLLMTMIPSNGSFETFWNYGLIVMHLAAYLIASWTTLIKNRSITIIKKFNWFRNMLVGVTIVWVYYLSNFLHLGLHYIWGPLFYSFLIYAFTYLFLNRSNFDLEKYVTSGLDTSSSKALFNEIKSLIESEYLFLEPTISLLTISSKLSRSPREVSQSINENAQRNFREFINHFRIENAKALLVELESKDDKISTIAYNSGFGTVTAFNVSFKKITGLTPSAYRRKHSII